MRYTEYAEDVCAGRIVVGKWVKLSCERFLSWFDKDDRYFDENAVERIINFISHLKHFKGSVANKKFILEPWQVNVISMMFGFKWKKNNLRVCREFYLSVARKNGKSALAAAIALYALIADGEQGAEVDILANSHKQAGLLFEVSQNFIQSVDNKGKYFKRFRDSIKFEKTKSKLLCLSSDAKSGVLDGLNPHFVVLDEVHGYADDSIPNVMRSGTFNRKQSMIMQTTTSGFNQFGYCKQYEDMCKSILSGVFEDDSVGCAIYQLDEEDDWKDEANWVKANPNMGITVEFEDFKREITKAINNVSMQYGVLTKNLNAWVSSTDCWISNDTLLDCVDNITFEKFKDKVIYVGIDLSAVSDITAVSYMLEEEGEFYFKTLYYLPESALTENENAEIYKKWRREGYLNVTFGNVVDYDEVLKDLMNVNKIALIEKILYDQWNATQFAINATAEGLPMMPYSQSLGSFNKPTKELERLIKMGKVHIDKNPITLWMFQNVHLKEDWNSNIKPVKQTQAGKIDGVIAMIESLGGLLQTPIYSKTIFTL